MLLKIAAALERSGKKYQISSSGQMIATTRRRLIYRREASLWSQARSAEMKARNKAAKESVGTHTVNPHTTTTTTTTAPSSSSSSSSNPGVVSVNNMSGGLSVTSPQLFQTITSNVDGGFSNITPLPLPTTAPPSSSSSSSSK